MNLRKKLLMGSLVVFAPVAAFAQSSTPIETLFAAVDLGSVATAVTTLGVAVIGIALAMKGISLVKRAVGKV